MGQAVGKGNDHPVSEEQLITLMGRTRLKLWVRDAVSLLWWVLRASLARVQRSGVRVLVYHSIADLHPRYDRWRMSVPAGRFAQQMRWLRQWGYAFVSMDDVLEMVKNERPIPPKAVAVTFDDGFRDVLTRAYPILREQGIPATLFVVAGSLDAHTPFPWLEHPEYFGPPLSRAELLGLSRDSLVAVGSHAWSHRKLSELPLADQEEEIVSSKTTLETLLNRSIRWFAYPYGHYGSFTEETVACLKRLRFTAACANVMGVNRVGDSPWTLKRTRVGWEDGSWRFRLKMDGAYDWCDHWRARKKISQSRPSSGTAQTLATVHHWGV